MSLVVSACLRQRLNPFGQTWTDPPENLCSHSSESADESGDQRFRELEQDRHLAA
jgi:hypothetical protein